MIEDTSENFQNYKQPSSTLTPTIGILPGLEGIEDSGKIIVMTDSDCIDSNSNFYASPYLREQGAARQDGPF